MAEQAIGKVTHYFTRLGVAGIELHDTLKVGDVVRFRGATSDFAQRASSIQIEHQFVQEAGPGSLIGLLVAQRVRPGDTVYRLTGDDAEKALQELMEDPKELDMMTH